MRTTSLSMLRSPHVLSGWTETLNVIRIMRELRVGDVPVGVLLLS